MNDLLSNHALLAALTGWILAQLLKFPILFLRRRTWNWRIIISPGGMPSSHTAMSTALTTTIALEAGLASPLLGICIALTLFIIYDAAGSRRAAMRQARAVNRLIEAWIAGHPEREIERVVELLGHEPSEVLAGLLLGLLIGWAFAAV